MNASRAKELRRMVYGTDFSIRERKFERNSKTGELRNTPGSRRANYQLLKRIMYGIGIEELRIGPEKYLIKGKPKEIPRAPVQIPVSKYEFMDKASLTLPQRTEFWLIRILKKAYYTIKKFMHS